MERYERDRLYDWLENGRVDVWLRRLMRERLAELEAALPADSPLLEYQRPSHDPDAWRNALAFLRARC